MFRTMLMPRMGWAKVMATKVATGTCKTTASSAQAEEFFKASQK